MRTKLSSLLCAFFFVFSGTGMASDSLTPHAAEYRVKISVLGGKLNTHVERTETGFFAESAIVATGLSRILVHGTIRENSEIESVDGALRPLRFRSVDTLSKGGQTVDLAFDWDKHVVGGLIGGEEFHTDIEDNVQDRVSLQYSLMADLLSGIERSQYLLQDEEELKVLSITNIGTQKMKVPFGTFEAIGIQHRAENSSRVTTLWCVKELGYLPVVIEQHRDGKRQMRAELTSYTKL